MKSKIAGFIVLAFLLAVSAQAQNFDITKVPKISVTGTAEIQVVPDEVTFSLGISKTDKNLQTAKAQNDEIIKGVTALARRFNIAPTDTKTDYIAVREKYECIQPKGEAVCKNIFVGYTVSRTIVIKLKDLTKFEDFLSEIVKLGVTEVGEVTFETSQLRKYKDQTRAMAMRAAKEKALALAKEIGQTIGKAISITEKDIDGYRSPYSNVRSNSFSVSDDGEESKTLAVGAISVKAQVEVEFLLN